MESHTIKTQENLNEVTQKKKKKRIKSDSGHFQWMKAEQLQYLKLFSP